MEDAMEEMSSNLSIETDMIEEILVTLPVKTLTRLKCVCKSWNSLITNRSFAEKHFKHHSLKRANKQVLIFRTVETEVVSLHSYESLNLVAPPLQIAKKPYSVRAISTPCNGLVCYKYSNNKKIKLCNPSTREFKLLPPSHFPRLYGYHRCSNHAIGFGIHNKDYKVISIAYYRPKSHVRNKLRLFKARIYSSSSNTWRSTSHDPPTLVNNIGIVPTVNGRCHWISYHHKLPRRQFILSFDMHNEMFRPMEFPRAFKFSSSRNLLRVLDGSLAVYIDCGVAVDIWAMQEYGVVESWTKKFKIRYASDSCGDPLFLWKNEILLMASFGKDHKVRLAWSYGDQRFEIDGKNWTFQAMLYEESLISLK
ncbi:F-box family protein [Striga asiatica]|uniref:F-box family protein n=1 Tax=Striga asiatica TaxID=4170 RepID=A0A5A7QD89_STRAF|nr:F-box family protein [Striga asiatica]